MVALAYTGKTKYVFSGDVIPLIKKYLFTNTVCDAMEL